MIRPLLLTLLCCAAAFAHDGPAFPIISDRTVGPYVISLWTHPDIGTGSFWIILDPPRGGKLPDHVKVQLAVQPVDKRIPERVFDSPLDDSSNQTQYKNLIPFDRQEVIRARVLVTSFAGPAEASATVEITPPGPNRWEFALYLLPFLGVGLLWLRAGMRKKGAA